MSSEASRSSSPALHVSILCGQTQTIPPRPSIPSSEPRWDREVDALIEKRLDEYFKSQGYDQCSEKSVTEQFLKFMNSKDKNTQQAAPDHPLSQFQEHLASVVGGVRTYDLQGKVSKANLAKVLRFLPESKDKRDSFEGRMDLLKLVASLGVKSVGFTPKDPSKEQTLFMSIDASESDQRAICSGIVPSVLPDSVIPVSSKSQKCEGDIPPDSKEPLRAIFHKVAGDSQSESVIISMNGGTYQFCKTPNSFQRTITPYDLKDDGEEVKFDS